MVTFCRFRRGIWSAGCVQITLRALSCLFYRGFVVTKWRAQIAILRPPAGQKSDDFFDHQNWDRREFRKFRLKRSVCCFLLARPQIGFQIVRIFCTLFGSVPLRFGGFFAISQNHLFCRLKTNYGFWAPSNFLIFRSRFGLLRFFEDRQCPVSHKN